MYKHMSGGNVFDFTRLNDPLTDKDEVEVLLRLLPESFPFISGIAIANSIEYDARLFYLDIRNGAKKSAFRNIGFRYSSSFCH